jgi:hypothetical protein
LRGSLFAIAFLLLISCSLNGNVFSIFLTGGLEIPAKYQPKYQPKSNHLNHMFHILDPNRIITVPPKNMTYMAKPLFFAGFDMKHMAEYETYGRR